MEISKFQWGGEMDQDEIKRLAGDEAERAVFRNSFLASLLWIAPALVISSLAWMSIGIQPNLIGRLIPAIVIAVVLYRSLYDYKNIVLSLGLTVFWVGFIFYISKIIGNTPAQSFVFAIIGGAFIFLIINRAFDIETSDIRDQLSNIISSTYDNKYGKVILVLIVFLSIYVLPTALVNIFKDDLTHQEVISEPESQPSISPLASHEDKNNVQRVLSSASTIRKSCNGMFENGIGKYQQSIPTTIWIDPSDIVAIRNNSNEADFTVPMRDIVNQSDGISFVARSPQGISYTVSCTDNGTTLSYENSVNEFARFTKTYTQD